MFLPLAEQTRLIHTIGEWVLRDIGMRPAHLELEITKGTAVDESDDVLVKLAALKALGVTMSIDDFGTEHSSLSRLAQLRRLGVPDDDGAAGRGRDGSAGGHAQHEDPGPSAAGGASPAPLLLRPSTSFALLARRGRSAYAQAAGRRPLSVVRVPRVP